MSDIVFGIRLTADGKDLVGAVRGSRDEIGKMADATKVATSEAAKLNAQQKDVAEQLARTAAASRMYWNTEYDALDRTTEAGRRVLITSQSIADGFDLQGRALTRAVETQALYASGFARDKAAQEAAAAGAADLAQGLETTSGSAIAAALSTAQARRELIVLGHEAMTGNVSRMPGSFMVLASRIGLTGGALVSVVLPIALVGVAAVALFKAFHDGAEEANQMNNALALTSGYAGMTRGTMRELAQEMSATGAITVGTAKDIVTQLVASGQIGAQAVGAVARLTSDYAAATGKDVAKIAPDLEKLFADPAKGAEELNKQMHFLSPAEIEYITHLERIGQLDAAQLELAQQLAAHIPKEIEQLGYLGSAWDGVKKFASAAWDAMTGAGRPKTVEEAVREAKAALDELQLPENTLQRAGPAGQAALQRVAEDTYPAYSAAEAEAANAAKANYITEQNRLKVIIDQTSEFSRMAAITDKIAATRKYDATVLTDAQRASLTSAEQQAVINTQEMTKSKAILDLEKQKADIAYGMGADARKAAADALKRSQQDIDAATKLQEISLGMAQEQNDAQLKLGTITQSEHDATKNYFALQKNAVDQIAIVEKLSGKGVTDDAAHALNLTLQNLKAQQEALTLQGSNQQAIDAKALTDAQYAARKTESEAAAKAQETNLAGITNEIAKIKEHTAALGKTKEQIDALKAAEQDRTLTALQADLDIATAENADNNNQAVTISYLTDQITLIKEKRAALVDEAAAQASADATRAYQENWKRSNDEVSRYLSDALMRGFDKGETFAKNFLKSLENGFKTLVLTPVIKFILSPISGAITSVMTGMGLSGAAGAANGFGGSGLNLLSSGSNVLSGGGVLAGGIGSTIIPGTIPMVEAGATEIGAGAIAAGEGASMVAGGAGISLGAMIPYVGLAVAAAAALGLFGGGSSRTASPQFSGLFSDNTITRGGLQPGPYGMAYTAMGSSRDDIWGGSIPQGLPQDQLTAFNKAVSLVFGNAAAAAKTLGLNVSVLDTVVGHMGATGNGVAADMQAALTSLGDTVATALVPNIKDFQASGESLSQTFDRLVSDTVGVQNMFNILGKGVKATLDLSEQIVAMFGGAANLNSQFSAYYDAFYSQAEKDALSSKQVADAFGSIHVAVPTTREQFKALVESLNLTTASGQATFKTLLGIAPAFDAVAKAADATAQAALTAADSYRTLGTSIEDAILQLRGGDLSPLLPQQKLAESSANLNALFDQARAGDTTALGALPQAATDFLTASRAFNASSQAYTADFAHVMDVLSVAGMTTSAAAAQQAAIAARSGLTVTPHAAGGIASGWSLVGEQGPELVNFSAPGRVYTAGQTGAVLGAGASKEDIDKLVRLMEETNVLLGRLIQTSTRDVKDQTARLATAVEDSAQTMGRVVARAAEAGTRA